MRFPLLCYILLHAFRMYRFFEVIEVMSQNYNKYVLSTYYTYIINYNKDLNFVFEVKRWYLSI